MVWHLSSCIVATRECHENVNLTMNKLMKYYKICISICLALIVIGCVKDSNGNHFVVDNDNEYEVIDLDQFFKEITFSVPFAGAKSINSRVRSFLYYKEILYLVSRQPVGKLMAVDSEGKVKFYLEANSGPNARFSSIGGVAIDKQSEEIIIYDNIDKTFYSYNLQGELLSKKSEDLVVNDIAINEAGCFLVDISSEVQTFEAQGEEKVGVISLCLEETNKVNTLHPNKSFREELAPFQNYSNFYQAEGNTYYHQDFTDTIYSIAEEEISSDFSFSFRVNDRRKEVLKASGNPMLLSEMIALNIPFAYYCVPFNGYISVSYGYASVETFAILNRSSGKTLFSTNKFIVNGNNINGRIDFNGGVFLNQMYLSEYNELNNGLPKEGIQYTILVPR